MSPRLIFLCLTALCCVGPALCESETPSPDEDPRENATVRWCTTSDDEQDKCLDISKKVGIYTLNWSDFRLECLQRATVGECLWEVNKGVASIMSVCSYRQYFAGEQYGLIPLLAEKYREEPEGVLNIDYASVAVIRKDDSRINKWEDLRGLKSCHSGLGTHAGWNVPISFMIEKGILKGDNCLDNVDNVDKFFSQSCAPRKKNVKVETDAKLCDLCKGIGEDKLCSSEDPYAGDLGALKCLDDGKGDIAFMKHTTMAKAISEGKMDASKKNDYVLLCPDDTKKPIDEYRQCNLGVVPATSLMASSNVGRYQRYAHKRFFFHMLNITDKDTLFNSSLYGGRNLMFNDRTITIFDPKAVYYTDFMGPSFIRTYKNQTLECSSEIPSIMRWCAVSEAEWAKCTQMQLSFDSEFIKPRLECVKGHSTANCIEKINNGSADLITLDSGDLYEFREDVTPILYEDYGKTDAKYWAVAVAKASNSAINLNNLKGMKSCHTGVGRTAGWKVPIANLISSKQITVENQCDVLNAVGNFFNGSCAPGAMDPKYVPKNGSMSENLCELCQGTGNNKCARKNEEPYYGYTGAFRCMAEGSGDVAFINHLTALENTDGKNTETWARNLKSSDFVLLCPDGSRKPLEDYKDCNLARVPAHTVVTSSNKTQTEIKTFIEAINKGQKLYADDGNKAFRMFYSPAGSKDLLFRDGTHQLLSIPEDQRSIKDWLGNYLPTAEMSNRCK